MPQRIDIKPNTTRRNRLKGFDYRTPGYYFISICQRDRRHLFSNIHCGQLTLLTRGLMVDEVTTEIEVRFDNTIVDASVIMPNHAHLLLGMNLNDQIQTQDSVVTVIEWWKSQTVTRYGWGVKNDGWDRYDESLWQEGYHDRIVRDQRELEYIRYYIEQNPKRWDEDTFFEED